MVAATTGPKYLRDIPSLPDDLLRVPHERLPPGQQLREMVLLHELKQRIRRARAAHEALHGPIDVEPPAEP